MFWKAENGCIGVDGTDMDYVSFGKGKDVLVMLPGLGDGLRTVKGMAAAMAVTYRMYAKDYRVYIFSRKNHLKQEDSTRDMAEDCAEVMEKLGIEKASVLGISQGGMIAQYLAIDFPALVDKLVLAVTLSRQNKMVQEVVGKWIRFAKQGNYKALMIDTAEKSYSENYLKKYRRFYPLLGRIGKPEDFKRFIIQAVSCMEHDAYGELENIRCPVLIIGGDSDRIIGKEASVEMDDRIENSRLYVYKGLGHGLYEETKDFNRRVMDFLSEER